MTSVAFHINVTDHLNYTCRLARKVVASGASLVVNGAGDVLDRFDRELWTISATDFVPHCRAGDAKSLTNRSAVLLCDTMGNATVRDVLINLAEDVPNGYEVFDRLIEVVSPEHLGRARERWKHYAQAGLKLTRYDLSSRTSP